MPLIGRFHRGTAGAVLLEHEPRPASEVAEHVFLHYADRRDAGGVLGDWVAAEVTDDAVVVGVAGTGVLVATEVARALSAPLDVLVVVPVMLPRLPGVCLGAVVDDATVLVDYELLRRHGIEWSELDDVVTRECAAANHRASVYRKGRAPLTVQGRTAVIVDDGIETGLAMSAAARAVRHRRPRKIVVASPLIAAAAERALAAEVDAVISPVVPSTVASRDHWYRRDERITDDEIARALGDTAANPA